MPIQSNCIVSYVMKRSAVIMTGGSWFEEDGNYWIIARMLMRAAIQLSFVNK
jgi:hypothetical protein